jgi:hypothetical protein
MNIDLRSGHDIEDRRPRRENREQTTDDRIRKAGGGSRKIWN